VAFDLNADGILCVEATDKGTGKSQNVTISNDSGRLSKEDIEKMVQEAEKFKEEDEKAAERIEAKNRFENHIYSIESTINGTGPKPPGASEEVINKMKEMFSESGEYGEDVKCVKEKLKECQEWLDDNADNATTEEITDKQKELDELWNPLISSIYKTTGGAAGAAGAAGPGAPGGPQGFDPSQFANMAAGMGAGMGNAPQDQGVQVEEVD